MFGKMISAFVRSATTRFISAKDGNVAVIFAIALLPVLGIVGAAIDYTRASAARSAIQAALDSTALMISRDATADPTISADQVQALATKYFNALYHNKDVTEVTPVATFSPNSSSAGSTVTITGSGTMQTDFMRVVNIPTMDVGASSQTAWGNVRMRVAMVLDNTGSMADDGKMPALQTAAKNLIDQLSKLAKQPGDVYVSIIPFAKDVNVGKSNYNQSWVNWSGQSDTWDENNGSCSGGSSYKNKSDCTSAYACSKSQYTNKNKCTSKGGTWQAANYTWTPDKHSSWNGCVTDRDQDYDTQKTAPVAGDTSTPSTLFPAEQYNACPTEITPLSNDWSSLKAGIDAMTPSGGTNQVIGMAWGWLSLLSSDPLNAPAKDSNYTYRDAIIVLTDGENTQDRWPAYGNGSKQNNCGANTPCIDARQATLCDNIKAVIDPKLNQPQYTIYTIQVSTGGGSSAVQPTLQACASSPDKFYMLTESNQIISAFDSIGTSLSQLRLAK
ncbi:MAG: TadE/TadG family protein [Xanthobacteraceae bacterium]|nr:TadE/TadG family protein [Xanthobacteraceae bacterium]